MPQASYELKTIWELLEDASDGEERASDYLEDRGFRCHSGMWFAPRSRNEAKYFSNQEISALSYLRDEWDYDGFEYRNIGKNLLGKPNESSESIIAWANKTFGPTVWQINAVRALQEAVELLVELSLKKPLAKIAREAGDVAIVLVRSFPTVRLTTTEQFSRYDKFLGDYKYKRDLTRGIITKLNERLGYNENMSFDFSSDNEHILSYLERICYLCNSNLFDEIQDKMIINRQRKWKLTGQGTGYHV